jgi:hypothetical protein
MVLEACWREIVTKTHSIRARMAGLPLWSQRGLLFILYAMAMFVAGMAISAQGRLR